MAAKRTDDEFIDDVKTLLNDISERTREGTEFLNELDQSFPKIVANSNHLAEVLRKHIEEIEIFRENLRAQGREDELKRCDIDSLISGLKIDSEKTTARTNIGLNALHEEMKQLCKDLD